MENTMLAEASLPQLRQKVLENTGRISRNEQAIERMNRRLDDGEAVVRERGAQLEAVRDEHEEARRTHEREMQEIREIMRLHAIEREADAKRWRAQLDEWSRQREEERQKSRAEWQERTRKWEKDMQELKESIKESQRSNEEYKASFAKSKAHLEATLADFSAETKASIAAVNAAITRVSVEFLGVTGHIVEGLASSALFKVFKEGGLDVVSLGKNIRPLDSAANGLMEIDALLGNDRFVIPVEVKANFTPKKVKHFEKKMEKFRELFPQYSGQEVLAAVAAVNYDRDSDKFAREEGLLVIRVDSNNVFSLDPFEEARLKRF